MKTCLAALFLGLVATFATAIDPGTVYIPPPCQGGVFVDVLCPSQYADWIEEIYNEGILVGCGSGAYCPTEPLTREQAAVAILRAEHRRSILTGVEACNVQSVKSIGKSPNWAICKGTVSNAGVQAGMIIVGTYQTRVADDQIPIRIYDIVDGAFSYEIQTGTSFMWMAAPLVPNPN